MQAKLPELNIFSVKNCSRFKSGVLLSAEETITDFKKDPEGPKSMSIGIVSYRANGILFKIVIEPFKMNDIESIHYYSKFSIAIFVHNTVYTHQVQPK